MSPQRSATGTFEWLKLERIVAASLGYGEGDESH